MTYRLMAFLVVLFMGVSSFAELKLARVFSDGMVLQRDQNVPVWGWTGPGSEVTVSFSGKELIATAGSDGQFMVRLEKMKANATPQSLVVKSGDDSIEVSNVLVGEVWLCSGQSNMAFPVSRANDFEQEKAAADYPQIRMFLTERKADSELQKDCKGDWKVCTPDNVGEFSATAYFFGRELYKELNVPVGLIRSCWGGTPIESWSSVASLEKFPEIMRKKNNQDKWARNFDEAAEEERFSKALAEWKEEVKRANANGEKQPPRPKKKGHPQKSPYYPTSLYNAMIHPLVPYGIRGAIWYQGESNAHTIKSAVFYRDLLESLVVSWRAVWNDEFPFYAVQLVNYNNSKREAMSWAFSRDSFLRFHKEVPNVGIAVGIDVGESEDIHPKNKQAIGYRLAQQALAKTYKKNVVAGGPIYKSMKKGGSTIIIKFDDVGSGLVAKDAAALKTFVIAGADRQFVSAEASIEGNTVVVSSPQVADPVAVRYAWADNPLECNLSNKEGFPASPFRTDDWMPAEK